MRFPQTDASYKSSFIIVLLLLASSAIASASCHTITPSGSGTKSGADWNNSCAGFSGSCAVASLVRGDSYYVGAGSYGSTTFNTPLSGTSIITIQAPTAADHCTATGFNSSTMIGQAVFTSQLTVSTGYWMITGSYRGTNWNDPTGYGFQVNNNAGGNTPYSADGIVVTSPADHVSFKYIDYVGSGNHQGLTAEFGLWFQFGPFNSPYVGYSHLHDGGCGPNLLMDGATYAVVEYNWIEKDWYDSANCHSEGIAMRPEGGANYVTVRYNYIENTPGTAPGVATPMSDGSNNTAWYIYGNVVFYNAAESTNQPFGGGDGVMDLFGNATWNNVYFYNNTFANLNVAGQGTAISFGAGWASIINTANIQNNLWYNAGSGSNTCTPTSGGSCNGVISNYNTFTSTNLFTHVADAVGADDFHLVTDTASWTPLANVTLPNGFVETLNTDLDGAIRSSSQGAFQFGPNNAPTPPTALTVIVQ